MHGGEGFGQGADLGGGDDDLRRRAEECVEEAEGGDGAAEGDPSSEPYADVLLATRPNVPSVHEGERPAWIHPVVGSGLAVK